MTRIGSSRLPRVNAEWLRIVLFLAVGGLQFVFDAGLFILLTHWGMAPSWTNLLTRFSAALLGFLLNGKLTFGQPRLTRRQLSKYLLLWVLLTLLSTGAVITIGQVAGIRAAWGMKILVEIPLAVLSFVLMRRWVFR
ncbi:MAG: GtrA family protein [Stenotrophomonas sp.]